MKEKIIISQVAEYVKERQLGEGTGHDWWHTERVWKIAKHLAKNEKANSFIVELGALLHDIADWKFSDGDDKAGSKVVNDLLPKLGVDKITTEKVAFIVDNVSYKGESHKNMINSIEGMVVQDADRLDAMGAVGIARTFAYGGSKNREIYNPNNKPKSNMNFHEYKNNNSSSLNHFYEKLLLLKDLLNTESAKEIGEHRHEYMENFLDEFYKEWEGEV